MDKKENENKMNEYELNENELDENELEKVTGGKGLTGTCQGCGKLLTSFFYGSYCEDCYEELNNSI